MSTLPTVQMSDTEKRLQAALRRVERMEKEIEQLKRPKKPSKAVKQVDERGGLIARRSTGRVTVVLPPERAMSRSSKRGKFWEHVAFNQ